MENKDIMYKRAYVWDKLSAAERQACMNMGEDYKAFLDNSKTERCCAAEIISRAEKAGFVEISQKAQLKCGDKVYYNNRGKAVMLAIIGRESIENGMNIVGSHIDSPRLDIKQNPVYEAGGTALLKTHYYGGIKKYQWTTLPLALYGVIVKANGEKVEIAVGDKCGDPVFYISDLLPHLAKDQMGKTLAEGIEGEGLNILIGSLPVDDTEASDRFKTALLTLLNERYGITEEDFVSAELEAVPAGAARDVGFDRGLIAAHGHDDRVCSYASLAAILNIENPVRTAVGLYVDKEEVGSIGATGMHSQFFNNLVGEMLALTNGGNCSDLAIRRALAHSTLLSADVAAAFDPNFPSVGDNANFANLGQGITMVKYTGSRGKSGANDAAAELVGKVRALFNANGVVYQTSELGKVDQGGGGTIAYIMANYDMDVIDAGVAMLSMHAPWEIVSKADVYMTSRAYGAFFVNYK